MDYWRRCMRVSFCGTFTFWRNINAQTENVKSFCGAHDEILIWIWVVRCVCVCGDLWFRLRHIRGTHIEWMHMRWKIAELESFNFNANFGIVFCLQWNWISLVKFFVIVCSWTFASMNDIFIVIVRNSFNFSIHSSQLRLRQAIPYLIDRTHIRNESNHHRRCLRLCRLIAHIIFRTRQNFSQPKQGRPMTTDDDELFSLTFLLLL